MTPEEVPPNICPTTGKVKYTSPRKAKMAAGRNRAFFWQSPICWL